MQPVASSTQQGLVGLPHIPNWRTSKMGYKFDCSDDLWQLDGSITINLGRMRDLDDGTREGLKKTLCRYAEELAAATTELAFG